MEKIIIGFGSNKGNREKNIKRAIKLIEKRIYIEKISSFFETKPEEKARGGKFLNGVIEGKTNLKAEELLYFLKCIEKKLGRKFPHQKGDEREIDMDIIFYGNKVIKNNFLQIPHLKWKTRYFVLKPIFEISPHFVDPVEKKSIKEIYEKRKNGNF